MAKQLRLLLKLSLENTIFCQMIMGGKMQLGLRITQKHAIFVRGWRKNVAILSVNYVNRKVYSNDCEKKR